MTMAEFTQGVSVGIVISGVFYFILTILMAWYYGRNKQT